MNLNLILYFILLLASLCSSRLLLRGRPKGKYGMLGKLEHEFNFRIKNEKLMIINELPPDQWFTQKLDHFNPADVRVWKQRYFVNDTFYQPGGPVFLQIGGEGEASPTWVVKGQMMKYAEKYKALALLLEHRYYGKSHPTPDLSVANLAYLTSEQALADLAYFIQSMKAKFDLAPDTKWISFGGSYPGSLSAWLRYKYPHLVHAAVASSAPILAKYDFKEYYEVVAKSLATVGPHCVPQIAKAIHIVESLIALPRGREILHDKFKLCEQIDFKKTLDVTNFYNSLMDNFAGVVQYNKDNRDFKGKNVTIDILCDLMTKSSSPLEGLAAINSLLLEVAEEPCLDFTYQSMINEVSSVDWNSSAAEGGRQWFYQTCVEFGFYQTSTSKAQPFGQHVPPKFYQKQCLDAFGPRFDLDLDLAGIKRTNINYGGYSMRPTRVVFPNGSIDPWHALGVTHDLSPDATAIYINGTAHCANMYPDSPDDPPQLIEARQKIEALIGQWLKEE